MRAKVPVTICKMVYEQRVEQVPYQVCRMVAEQQTIRVPHCVEKAHPRNLYVQRSASGVLPPAVGCLRTAHRRGRRSSGARCAGDATIATPHSGHARTHAGLRRK